MYLSRHLVDGRVGGDAMEHIDDHLGKLAVDLWLNE